MILAIKYLKKIYIKGVKTEEILTHRRWSIDIIS